MRDDIVGADHAADKAGGRAREEERRLNELVAKEEHKERGDEEATRDRDRRRDVAVELLLRRGGVEVHVADLREEGDGAGRLVEHDAREEVLA